MSLLPSELWQHILRVRGDLCYLLGRDHWKKEWLKNISVVIEQYRSCADGCSKFYTFQIFNHRDLQNPDHRKMVRVNAGHRTPLRLKPILRGCTTFIAFARNSNAQIGSRDFWVQNKYSSCQ